MVTGRAFRQRTRSFMVQRQTLRPGTCSVYAEPYIVDYLRRAVENARIRTSQCGARPLN